MSLGKHRSPGRREPGNARRRAQERRQTVIVLTVFVLALIASVGSWVVFFAAWTPATVGQAPPFTLPSSTGDLVALADFLGKQDVVLVFYMAAT